jgi:tetratricopeptide (TPR) repeat protein
MDLKRFKEAAEQLRQCLNKRSRPTLSPINPEIRKAGPRHCLALCALGLADHDGAARAFAEALADDPQSRKVRLDYARFLAATGQAVEALQQLHGAISGQPEDLGVWQFGGQVALSRPEFLEFARDWTGEAVKFFPDDATLAQQNAEALLLSGQAEAALAQWRKFGFSTNPAHQAALVLCELVVGGASPASTGSDEAAVSQEFLNWYRKLLNAGVADLIERLNAQLEPCRAALPTAAKVLESVLVEAGV